MSFEQAVLKIVEFGYPERWARINIQYALEIAGVHSIPSLLEHASYLSDIEILERFGKRAGAVVRILKDEEGGAGVPAATTPTRPLAGCALELDLP